MPSTTFASSFNSSEGDISQFLDNLDPNMVVYDSWLNKKGKIHQKTWKERFCVAYTDRKLVIFRHQDDKLPCAYIELCDVITINVYMPNMLNTLPKLSKNPSISQNSSMDRWLAEMKEFEDDPDKGKKKHEVRQRSVSLSLKRQSLKGASDVFAFELVTPKRNWVFSVADADIFQEWMSVLRDLCFGKKIHGGFLRKQGEKYKTWRQRYFALYDCNELRYYEDGALQQNKGKIELNKVRNITVPDTSKYHYPHCIELHTSDRLWILAGQNPQERDVWLKHIKNSMKRHRRRFVPDAAGHVSLYDAGNNEWRRYYIAIHAHKSSNRLCCFDDVSYCKELEGFTCFGDKNFDILCKAKMRHVIPLHAALDTIMLDDHDFRGIFAQCDVKELKIRKHIFCIRVQGGDDSEVSYYFAAYPNSAESTQKWIDIVVSSLSTQKQNIHMRLSDIGYSPTDITAAIEQHENENGTEDYSFDKIKKIVDRMTKSQISVKKDDANFHGQKRSSNSSRSKPDALKLKPRQSAPTAVITKMFKTPMQPLKEEKTMSDGMPAVQDSPTSGSHNSFDKILDERNCEHWSVIDVCLWMRSFENSLITNLYPNILTELKTAQISGSKLKKLKNFDLQRMGVGDDLHRALIMEALAALS